MLPHHLDTLRHRIPGMDHDRDPILERPLDLQVKRLILLALKRPVPIEIQPDLPYRRPGAAARSSSTNLSSVSIILLHRTRVQTRHPEQHRDALPPGPAAPPANRYPPSADKTAQPLLSQPAVYLVPVAVKFLAI
jgi:hypothetical protein